MSSNTFAARAGRWSAQHRKKAILGWFAFVILATVLGGMVGQKKLADEDTGNGDDRIAVRDGERDVVNCGPGIDKALLDFKDVTEDNSCEVVSRRAPGRNDSRIEDRNQGDQP